MQYVEQSAQVRLTVIVLLCQMVPNESHAVLSVANSPWRTSLHCLTQVEMAILNQAKSSVNSCFSVIQDAVYFSITLLPLLLLCPFTHTSDESLSLSFLCMCVCVCVALVIPTAELEQLGSYSPGVHGLPHLRWGQSTAAEVHPQAWQVRQKHVP